MSRGDATAIRRCALPAAALSKDLGLLVANDALAALVGRSAASLKGEPLLEFVDADQRAAVRDRLQSLRSGSLQLRIRLNNGTGRRALMIASRGGARSPLIAHFVPTDGTDDRTDLVDALEHAAWEWRRTFDAVETPIVIAGVDSIVARINRSARMLLGRQYGEIVGRSLADLPAAEPWTSMIDLTREVQERRSPAARQVKDPVGRTLDLLAMLFNADDPNDVRVIVIVWDVSALVDLQTRVEQQRTMATMGALVAGVAHEVRNPLFAISATVDAMEQASKGALAEYFEVLREEIDRMTHLMEDLLAYGRPAAPVFQPVSVAEIVDVVIRNCGTLAKRQNVKLKKALHANPTVAADRERLGRALENLVDNAVQHSPAGSTVKVESATRAQGRTRYVDLKVLDRGRGFTAEDLPRIFDPFFSRRKGGTGLGLALVQQIVQEHGGDVTADNRSGGGAEVILSIPLPRE